MAEVRYLHPVTDLPIPVARVLAGAEDCASVLVLGELEDGTFYAASSTSDIQRLLWWVETFKHALVCGEYSDG